MIILRGQNLAQLGFAARVFLREFDEAVLFCVRVSGTFERVAGCEGREIGWREEKGSDAEVCAFGRRFARFEEG